MSFTYILQTLLDGLLMGGVYGLVAIGLTLIFGVMKVINFAHGALMMLGMYVTYWAFALLHIDPYVSIVITIPILFFVGVCFQKFLINPIIDAPAHNQLLLTLGVSLFLENLVVFLWSPNYRVVRTSYEFVYFYIGDVSVSLLRLLAFCVAMLVASIVYLVLTKTDLGKAIRAASEEPGGALLMGINVRRIYWITFGIGAACAGVSGTAVAPFFPVYPTVGGVFVITAFMVVVLGGMGSVIGAFVGGLIIGVADNVGGLFFPGAMKHLLSFIIFILILLFRPAGLFGGSK
ncbi:MAG: branched-chain amino acid ABC transporter permease [Desulfobacteraceae bacterium]|nr:MAG: branched-chain amino acid ABC transporter permease [Desulfobacteraceae bacterium]